MISRRTGHIAFAAAMLLPLLASAAAPVAAHGRSRLWTRSIPVADAYFRGFETNGTPEYIPAPLCQRDLRGVAGEDCRDPYAFWIPSEGNVKAPWATGSVPTRDW